jgi:GTP-binding protein
VDTAGLRRKRQIDQDVEYYGYVRAMRAIDDADIALLVVDSSVGVTEQDQRVARFAQDRGSGLVVLMNKWDTVDGENRREELAWQVEKRLGFVGYAPVIRISALTGAKVGRIFEAIDFVFENYTRKIPTSQLNKLLTEMREFGHTVSKQGRVLKVHYMTQTGTKPPRFALFANHPALANEYYARYVENRLRDTFELTGTPIVLKFRAKE